MDEEGNGKSSLVDRIARLSGEPKAKEKKGVSVADPRKQRRGQEMEEEKRGQNREITLMLIGLHGEEDKSLVGGKKEKAQTGLRELNVHSDWLAPSEGMEIVRLLLREKMLKSCSFVINLATLDIDGALSSNLSPEEKTIIERLRVFGHRAQGLWERFDGEVRFDLGLGIVEGEGNPNPQAIIEFYGDTERLKGKFEAFYQQWIEGQKDLAGSPAASLTTPLVANLSPK